MAKDVFIVDEIKEVVARVNIALGKINFGKVVYYDYGHVIELNQRMQEITDSPTEKDKKFPRILLLTDIPINRKIVGFYGQAKLRIVICNITESTYTSEQRTEFNFKPVLHPIKNVFLDELGKYGKFVFDTVPTPIETDCYFYGSQINDKNRFNDYIDAIELDDLIVNITQQVC